MDNREQLRRITELTEQIAGLPKGYLSKKTIGGKVYYYHQWSENGVKQSRYLHDSEIAPLADKIEKRKELQAQLRMLKSQKSRRNEATGMKCTFMHKRTPVAELELDDVTGFIQKIGSVYAPEHLPIGIPVRNEIADRAAFNDWWRDRSIPASRSGVREALESLGVADTKMLLVRCYGLSLSDQYWICPEGAELRWEDINFFQNDFSEDIGDVLFGERKKKDALNFSSPDSTSDGNLKKRWKIIDGKRCLIKGGSNPFRQQPFNEVIASGIMERLGIPHVSYTVIWSKDAPYSVCEDFVTENTELIPAWRLLQAKKQKNSTSRYRHLLECCELLGIGNITPFLDRMLVLDYIIANEDRHFNNFGALRNAETLEWLGMAPIYDSGSSLGYSDIIKHSRCNWVTAHRFRRYICKCYHWAIRRGITTFIADYTSPFGLLAMETLISYKNHGADLQLYSARSDYIGKRRSYRLIPETNLEIIYLTMNCDYDYRLPPKVVGNVVFRHVGTVCSEKGIWVSKKWIPGYLIEAWFEP